VDHVDLKIPPRGIISVVGESGSGKSTLGKTTLGLIRPYSGSVLFRGKDIWKLDPNEYKEYRKNAQFIPQDPYSSLHPFRKVGTVLGEILRYHRVANSSKDIREGIEELLEKVGLTPPSKYINKYPFELSGGERQRIAIARAIALKPAYIVADEPVTMLDASIKVGIIRTLIQLINDLRSSLLFITHELSLVEAFGRDTEVLVMYLGEIVEKGLAEKVFVNPAHPYTQALIEALPVADPEAAKKKKLLLTNVNPPNPINKPKGCPFSDRCPYAMEVCKIEHPQMKSLSANHQVSCHLY
jgi:oligopeptide/dipeptide ABC transporter ATP-binding protein